MKLIKYLVVTLAFLTITTGSFAQLRLGGGLGFGFEQEAFTLFARAGYDFTDRLRTNATFQYYFLGDASNDLIDQNAFSVNLHANYDFANLPTMDLYGLAGLNIYKYDVETLGSKVNDTDLGLDIGVGGLLGVADRIDILSELIYTLGGTSGLHFNIGLMFNITGGR